MMSYEFPKRVLALLIRVGLAIAGSHTQRKAFRQHQRHGDGSTGAVVVGATVTLTNTDRGEVIRVLTTGSDRLFHRGSLTPRHLHREIANQDSRRKP